MIVKSLLLIVHFCVHTIVLFSIKQNFPIISNVTLFIFGFSLQMQHRALKELQKFKGDSPYPTTMVKVNVVKVGHTASFTSSSEDKAAMLNFSVSDGTEAMIVAPPSVMKVNLVK